MPGGGNFSGTGLLGRCPAELLYVRQGTTSDDSALLITDRVVHDEDIGPIGYCLRHYCRHDIDRVWLRIGQARHLTELGAVHRDGDTIHGDGVHLHPGGGAPGHLPGRRNGDYRTGRSGRHQV